MRILHVIPAVAPQYGGPSTAVVPMCNALMKAGVETLIVATNADGERCLNVPLGKQTTWQGVPALFFKRDFSESFKYSSGLARWLRHSVSRFDVVHVHAVLSHSCLAAASASRLARIPYVLRPLGTLAPWSLRQKAWRKRVTLALGARRAIHEAEAIHCTSDRERRGIQEAFPGAKAVVIPLGVDAALFEGSEWSGPERDRDRYVLAISRLHPKKNLETLIEAFGRAAARQREPWRLVIAGDGEPRYVDRLQQLARQNGVENRVSFPGWIDGALKQELMRGASVFALASFHENFGVSVLEAMASSVPVLLSSEVDLADVVRQESAGWVVEPTVDSLVIGLSEALGNTMERSSRALAARTAARRFSWPEITTDLVAFYRRLIRNDQHEDSILPSSAIA